MKICMFSNLYPPVVSGSSTQSASLARELVKRGHDVTVITAHVDSNTPANEIVDGVHIYRIPSLRLPQMGISLNFPWLSWAFTIGNQKRIAKIIEDFQPDVLHLHNHMFDLAFSAVRMKRRFKLPLVTTLHTVIRHSNPMYNALLYPIDRQLLRRIVINQSNHLIHPDVNIEEYAEDAFKATKAQGTIIPYGIQLSDSPVAETVEEIKTRFNLHDKWVILSLGHLHEIRNRRDLVQALPHILKTHPNTVLLIVGAVATETPRTLARQLGVDHAVIFAGAAPHDQIPAFLSIADIEAHWLNQDDPEKTSLGIASLEAMSAGKTILAAANLDTYGQGILQHNENIVLVEPNQPEALAQTITNLLDDKALRTEIGRKAQEIIATHFSWESVCSKTVDVYEAVRNVHSNGEKSP